MAHYDAILIGTGQANPSLAAALANMGERVALIEGHVLGGSCVNFGCTPTKTLRKSARVAYLARQASDFGVHVGPVTIDFEAVMARKNHVVDSSRNGLHGWLSSIPTLDLYQGWGHFVGKEGDDFLVQVGEQMLQAPRVYLNTGTRALIPSIEGIHTVPYMDNIGLMSLTELPSHLLILGGSYIGLEMAQIFRRLGSDVTVIEPSPRLIGREDAEVSQAVADLLAGEGITILIGQSATHAESIDGGIALQVGDERLMGSHLLVATGRIPNTDTLNLQSIGLDTDARGFITTNGRLETSVDGVWALGDINARGAFTHTSYQDHEIVLANYRGGERSADGRITTYALYTDPALGRVGMTEAQARQSGKRVLMAVHHMADVSRAKEESETVGLIKLLVDADTEQFLGATIFGINGDEIVQVISNYMATGASYRWMQDALPIHPTVTEFFPTILGKLTPLS